jgi:hypothetical protein
LDLINAWKRSIKFGASAILLEGKGFKVTFYGAGCEAISSACLSEMGFMLKNLYLDEQASSFPDTLMEEYTQTMSIQNKPHASGRVKAGDVSQRVGVESM